MTFDPDELAAWTAANRRAREAYEREPISARKTACRCGKRTTHGSGLCRRCR